MLISNGVVIQGVISQAALVQGGGGPAERDIWLVLLLRVGGVCEGEVSRGEKGGEGGGWREGVEGA